MYRETGTARGATLPRAFLCRGGWPAWVRCYNHRICRRRSRGSAAACFFGRQAPRLRESCMNDERFSFLKELVEAPSPSGYEQPARVIWRREVEGVADELRTDLHGNTIATLNP